MTPHELVLFGLVWLVGIVLFAGLFYAFGEQEPDPEPPRR